MHNVGKASICVGRLRAALHLVRDFKSTSFQFHLAQPHEITLYAAVGLRAYKGRTQTVRSKAMGRI